MGQRPKCFELQSLDLKSYSYIHLLNRNMNWAQGCLEHVVLHCCVTSVLDLILLSGPKVFLINIIGPKVVLKEMSGPMVVLI